MLSAFLMGKAWSEAATTCDCHVDWLEAKGIGHDTTGEAGIARVQLTFGTRSRILSTSPLTSRISSLHLSSLSFRLRTAPSTSSITTFTRSRSVSSDACRVCVDSVRDVSNDWAWSYDSSSDCEVCWKAVAVGGWRCGTRYFWGQLDKLGREEREGRHVRQVCVKRKGRCGDLVQDVPVPAPSDHRPPRLR